MDGRDSLKWRSIFSFPMKYVIQIRVQSREREEERKKRKFFVVKLRIGQFFFDYVSS